jgi:hypothetical protein
MTPIQEVQQLKDNFLSSISGLFYHDQTIFSIEFEDLESVETELDIDPIYLTQDDILTTLDEFGNEIDDKLTSMPIEVIAYILTLIQNKKYTVYERI